MLVSKLKIFLKTHFYLNDGSQEASEINSEVFFTGFSFWKLPKIFSLRSGLAFALNTSESGSFIGSLSGHGILTCNLISKHSYFSWTSTSSGNGLVQQMGTVWEPFMLIRTTQIMVVSVRIDMAANLIERIYYLVGKLRDNIY